ncbi:MAG: helix-turn-helix transcriptional regulator [Acidimicrobiales bacterium]|jgi:DNA-binding CsgD family transcriptional regulator|nr:helix-turn-helix transcriptional regulator [Acidimicrobiales bacterium]HMS89399.1 helix-turn-helix transcriptional regulator [Acidimicrobiales bacterium]
MASSLTLDRVRSDIDVLARAGLHMATFLEEVDASLQRAVPHVAACMATVDPATHLLTSTYKFGDLYGRDEHDVEWSLHEFGEQCPDSFTALFDRPQAAYGVDLENRGDVAASSRLRTVIEPYYGYRDEVRVVARQGGCGWGGMALFRGTDDQPFSAEEVAFLATLSEPLATGLRSGLLVRLIGRDAAPGDLGPAVLIVGADDRLVRTSMGTEDLLRELTSGDNMADASGTIYSLVAGARRYAAGLSDRLPRARVRMPSGRWLVLNASPLADVDGPSGEVVITIEEARPPEIVPLVVAAFQLTARERDVTQLVLQGVDTRDMAAALGLSRYTVQDHLKSVFEKAGVRSRRELVARVYFDQYVPRMGADLAPSGWFTPDPTPALGDATSVR